MLTPLLEDERQELRNSLNLAPIDVLETHLRVAISLGTLPDDLTDVITSNSDEHVQEYVVQTLFASLKKEMVRKSCDKEGQCMLPPRLVTALLLDASFDVFDTTVSCLMKSFTREQIILTLRRILEMSTNHSDTMAWVRGHTRYALNPGSSFTLMLIERTEDELLADTLSWPGRQSDNNWYSWAESINLEALRNCPKTVMALYNKCDTVQQTHIAKGIVAIHPDVMIRKQALDQLLRISAKKLVEESINSYYAGRPYRMKNAMKETLQREVTKPNLLRVFASDPSDEIRLMLVKGTNDRQTLTTLKSDSSSIIAALATANLAKIELRAERQYKYHQRKKGEPIPTV